MEITLQLNCSNIDFNEVSDILRRVGMGYFDGEIHKKAFENSHSVVFAFHAKQLIGFGRAISDGAYEAAVYDIAVVPEYQGIGVGKLIMDSIIERLSFCNIILFASPGKEPFYQKLKFRKLKTGMAIFVKEELMHSAGFTE